MSSESLRKAIFAMAVNKKSEKVQEKIQQQVNLTLNEWETILHGYVNITTQLTQITKLAEQQEHITCVRKTLKECTDLARAGTETFEKIWRLVELSLPISTMDHNWMTSILKHNKLLVEIKESLSSLLLFSSNREVIALNNHFKITFPLPKNYNQFCSNILPITFQICILNKHYFHSYFL